MAPITQSVENTARALIVSITYKNQVFMDWKMELGNNHGTAFQLRALLTEQYSYDPGNITMLLEGHPEYLSPTKENILREMRQLVADSKDGDRFVFYYAGHGDQQEAERDLREEDGMDEFIIPVDHDEFRNIILDDQIKEILVDTLTHKTVHLTGIFDCCHSGTMMDLYEYLEYERVTGTIRQAPSSSDAVPPYIGRSRRIPIHRDPLHLGKNYILSKYSDIIPPAADTASETAVPKVSQEDIETVVQYDDLLGKSGLSNIDLFGAIRYSARGPSNTKVTKAKLKVEGATIKTAPGVTEITNKPMACVVSWSSCADNQLTWENRNGEAMGKIMFDFLKLTPRPTYNELLKELDARMYERDLDRQSKWNRDEFVFQRPQIGSLVPLDMNSTIVI